MPDVDALNYPYIRVRDVEWLKRTLLLFAHVCRMTPIHEAPLDDPEIAPFVWQYGTRGPLLRPADLWSPHVHDAQIDLIHDLDTVLEGPDGNNLLRRFRARFSRTWDSGEAAKVPTVWERRMAPDASFQIHHGKILPELTDFLLRRGLAWEPHDYESHGARYLEMNPRLGEAIMATLAVACAEDQGLRVVTEFPKLHGKLLGVSRESILDACVKDPQKGRVKPRRDVAEFLVYRRCDVSALTAERIAALKSERDALAAFRERLEAISARIPSPMYNDDLLQQRLNDEVNAIFRAWREDQRNLSGFARRLFGDGALGDPIKALGELVKGSLKAENTAAGIAAGLAANGTHSAAGTTLLHVAGDAAFGFVVAFSIRAVRVWDDMRRDARASPYRYLTALQNEGVSFAMTV